MLTVNAILLLMSLSIWGRWGKDCHSLPPNFMFHWPTVFPDYNLGLKIFVWVICQVSSEESPLRFLMAKIIPYAQDRTAWNNEVVSSLSLDILKMEEKRPKILSREFKNQMVGGETITTGAIVFQRTTDSRCMKVEQHLPPGALDTEEWPNPLNYDPFTRLV